MLPALSSGRPASPFGLQRCGVRNQPPLFGKMSKSDFDRILAQAEPPLVFYLPLDKGGESQRAHLFGPLKPYVPVSRRSLKELIYTITRGKGFKGLNLNREFTGWLVGVRFEGHSKDAITHRLILEQEQGGEAKIINVSLDDTFWTRAGRRLYKVRAGIQKKMRQLIKTLGFSGSS